MVDFVPNLDAVRILENVPYHFSRRRNFAVYFKLSEIKEKGIVSTFNPKAIAKPYEFVLTVSYKYIRV